MCHKCFLFSGKQKGAVVEGRDYLRFLHAFFFFFLFLLFLSSRAKEQERSSSTFMPSLVFVIVGLEKKNEISENARGFTYSKFVFNVTDRIKELPSNLMVSNDRYCC